MGCFAKRLLAKRRSRPEEHLLGTIARDGPPAPEDLETLRAGYAEAVAKGKMSRSGLSWPWRPEEPTQPLWPISLSVLNLLVTGDPTRIRECANHETCGWLFYDTTKNKSRRWCSMFLSATS